jgi:aspartyl protease family protein
MRFGSFFVATVVFGALVGWFAPGAPPPAPAAAPDAPAASEANHLGVAHSTARRSGEVVLQRDANGHFYAEVSTDTGKALMLVDTGATVVALTGNDASMMGVDWNPGDVRPVARGASGDVYGVPVVVERFEVGGIEARGVQAVVVPEDLDISLLGQSFLSKVNRVEVSGDEMVLRD